MKPVRGKLDSYAAEKMSGGRRYESEALTLPALVAAWVGLRSTGTSASKANSWTVERIPVMIELTQMSNTSASSQRRGEI